MRTTEIKAAVLAVCVVSAAKSLIGQMTGNMKMKDQLRLILNIILALVITTPVVSGLAGFSLPETDIGSCIDYDSARELYDRALAEQTASNVNDILTEQLAAAGIDCGKINAEVNISPEGSISINRVTVSTEDILGAAEVIRNTLGAETEVINEDTW